MKIKFLLITISVIILLCIPNVSSLTINPNGRDIIVYNSLETNNDTIVFLYNTGLGYYNQKSFFNGTTFEYFETITYLNKSEMRFASHNSYTFADFEQIITVTYPNSYSIVLDYNRVSYEFELFEDIVYIKVISNLVFPDNSLINQTGEFTFNITSSILTNSLTYSYDYKELTLNVTEIIGSYNIPIDEDNINIYDVSFIGTLSGFICMFSLFAVPMVCAYKIKHTGEKLKWSVYGFILICIIFFCMIAFFQMG